MSDRTPRARAGAAADAVAEPVVEATALRRSFGGRRAVDGVDFALGRAQCLVVFGPNGAGKTTLLRLLAGLLKPTAGVARVGGVRLPGGAAARAQVGLISHHSMLYEALTARENVEFAARLHGVDAPREAAEAALRVMRVADRAATPVRALSRGLQQRVSIARALVHAPRVLLLDEPYSGLDDAGAAALAALLEARRGEGATLVLVTHNVAEGLALATHAAIMQRGRFARFDARAAIEPPAYAAAYRELLAAGAR